MFLMTQLPVKKAVISTAAMTAGAGLALIGYALVVGTWDWYKTEVRPARRK